MNIATGAPATGAPATGAPATGAPATGAPATGAPATGAPATGAPQVRFAAQLVLSKPETYLACEIIADAERALRQQGAASAAARLGLLFDLLEDRLVASSDGGERPSDVSRPEARTPTPGS